MTDIIRPTQFARGEPEPAAVEAPIEAVPLTFEACEIAEIRYGEELLGDLLPEELALFLTYYEANTELTALEREVGGTQLQAFGADYRSGKVHAAMNTDKGYEPSTNADPALMREFFTAVAKVNHLKGVLFWMLGERFNAHDWSIGIRTKRRAVKVKRRW